MCKRVNTRSSLSPVATCGRKDQGCTTFKSLYINIKAARRPGSILALHLFCGSFFFFLLFWVWLWLKTYTVGPQFVIQPVYHSCQNGIHYLKDRQLLSFNSSNATVTWRKNNFSATEDIISVETEDIFFPFSYFSDTCEAAAAAVINQGNQSQ